MIYNVTETNYKHHGAVIFGNININACAATT